jgi:hypothetical protein
MPHKVFDSDHEQRVEARVQALLTTIDEKPPVKFRPCDVSKEMRPLKLGKVCDIDGIPNKRLGRFPRRSLVHVTHLFNHCLRPCQFPAPWKEAKSTALPKPAKNPKFPENLRPISLLSIMDKGFEKLILKTIHRHNAERNLLNASQIGFRARHSKTLQFMRLTDRVSLNLNNNMWTAAVFLDIEKAFGTT